MTREELVHLTREFLLAYNQNDPDIEAVRERLARALTEEP